MTELRTDRLTLRPIGPVDAAELHAAVVGRHDVMRWLSSGRAQDLPTAQEMCRDHERHWRRHGFGDFAVRDSCDGRFLGRACLDLALGRLGMTDVFAFVLPDNERSIALVTRLGAQQAGTVTSSGRDCLRFRFVASASPPSP